jgi:hypothetical protein
MACLRGVYTSARIRDFGVRTRTACRRAPSRRDVRLAAHLGCDIEARDEGAWIHGHLEMLYKLSERVCLCVNLRLHVAFGSIRRNLPRRGRRLAHSVPVGALRGQLQAEALLDITLPGPLGQGRRWATATKRNCRPESAELKDHLT